METKFCINCKHLLGKRSDTNAIANWRCHHPSNIASLSYNIVTGQQVTVYKKLASSLSDLQATLPQIELTRLLGNCGVEGKLFEEYIQPDYNSSAYQEPAARPAPRPKNKQLTADDI